MTDLELTTLLRDHIRSDEPPLGLDASAAILSGRRAVRRRRVRRGAAALVIGTAAAVAAPFAVGDGGGGTTGVDPATQRALETYDAGAMPGVLYRAIGPQVNAELPEIALDRDFAAYDDQGVRVPQQDWDKASSMELTFGGDGDHRVRLALLHARSEAEGDARRSCRSDVQAGYSFSCEVIVVDGELVTSRVYAIRKLDRDDPGSGGWGALSRQELRTGEVSVTNPIRRPIDLDEVYFTRSVESVHSETFLTVVGETVRARDHATAEAAFAIPVSDLVDLVTDPTLVMPEPPRGENGCAWMVHSENITCGRTED